MEKQQSKSRLLREQRLALLPKQQGATLWLTGLSAAGKTTLGYALEKLLLQRGFSAYVLDGDELRLGLNAGLDFTHANREENIRRVSEVAKLMADAGLIVIVCLISPYRADRVKARQIHQQADLDFLEVYVDTPLSVCEQRDPKGLYAKARSGEIAHFTGIDDPYEIPEQAELIVGSEKMLPEQSALSVYAELIQRQLIWEK